MEQLLNRGTAISELAYLRVLQLVHIQTSLLVEDLKGYELPSVTPRSPLDTTEFRRTLSGNASSTGPATSTAIGTMLETAMEELFVQQTEGQRYLERESASLGQLYSNLLSNYTRYHVRTDSTTNYAHANNFRCCQFNRHKTRRENHPCLTVW
jgi:hypothetical protein